MILFRYITKGLPRPFFYSLVTITMIFMMMISVRLLPRVMGRGIPVEVILQLFGLKMVAYLALAVPLAMLVSTLMVFGRLSSDNEFTAIKAAGIGLRQLLPPIIVTGALVSVLLAFFNSTILPESNVRGQQLYRDIMRTKPAALIQPRILMRDFPGYAIMVDSVDHGRGKLFDIIIFADEKDQSPSVTVADSGTLFLTDDEQELELTLYSGETITDGTKANSHELYKIEFSKQLIYFENPARDFDKSKEVTQNRNDREMTTNQLLEEVHKSKERLKDQEALHQKRIDAILTFYDSLLVISRTVTDTSNPDTLVEGAIDSEIVFLDGVTDTLVDTVHTHDSLVTFSEWFHAMDPGARRNSAREYIRREQHIARIRSNRIERAALKLNGDMVEVHKKYSLALSALVFAILGVSFGVVGRSGSVAVSIIYAALVYIVNYVFLIGGESLANRGVISASIAMWSGDVVLGLFALFLIARSNRDSGILIDFGRIWGLIRYPFLFVFRKLRGNAPTKRKKKSIEKVLRKQTNVSKAKEFLTSIPRRVVHVILPTIEAYLFGRFINFFVILLGSLIVLFSVLDYVGNINSFRGALPLELVDYYKSFVIAFLPMILPISMLLAVMMTIGSFSKKQEITAIKASGINIIKATFPFLIFGLLISGANFWFNEQMVVQANADLELYRDIFSARRNNRPIPTAIKSYRRNFYYFNGTQKVFRFAFFQTEPPRADRVLYYIFDKHRLQTVISADRMVYDSSWTLVEGFVNKFQDGGEIHVTPFDSLPLPNLEQTPKQMVKEVKRIELMSYGELKESMALAEQRGESVEKYRADLYFKFALPLMNLIVILIGVAVTAKAGKRGGAVNFGVGILLVFSYWGVAQFLLLFGRGGTIPPLVAAWAGTVFFLILGITMYRRAAR